MADMARLVECLPEGQPISYDEAVRLIIAAAGGRVPLPEGDAKSIVRGHIESLVFYGLLRRLGGGLRPNVVRVATAECLKAHHNPDRRSTREAVLDEWGTPRDYLRGVLPPRTSASACGPCCFAGMPPIASKARRPFNSLKPKVS